MLRIPNAIILLHIQKVYGTAAVGTEFKPRTQTREGSTGTKRYSVVCLGLFTAVVSH